jgi:hypothetical protein
MRDTVTDPVCGMTIDRDRAVASEEHGGQVFVWSPVIARPAYPNRLLALRLQFLMRRRACPEPPRRDG